MPHQWSADQSQRLWDARPYTLIARNEGIINRQQCLQQANRDCTQRNERDEADFQRLHMQQNQHPNAQQTLGTQDTQNLEFRVKHSSWTYCSECYKLLPLRLLPRLKNKPMTKPKNGCTCQERRNPTPTNDDIPNVLRNLSLPEICSLRPLTIHNGDCTHIENGYQQKGGIFRLKWSRLCPWKRKLVPFQILHHGNVPTHHTIT